MILYRRYIAYKEVNIIHRIYELYRKISSLNFHVSTTRNLNVDRIERDLTEIKDLVDGLLNDIKKAKEKILNKNLKSCTK